ncbi:MAG: hypothetical protein A2749_01940 [Parcubacteria group bacterium RIFCSPHIGHO2_01_FULL_45_26]|nr:MAG: hypothetical protein A2749_01940 [Parcubacteria group bacterium RIFCSPHIGHO2_01_FULL_45_26]
MDGQTTIRQTICRKLGALGGNMETMDGRLDQVRRLFKGLRERCDELGLEWRIAEDRLSSGNWGSDGTNLYLDVLAGIIAGTMQFPALRPPKEIFEDASLTEQVRDQALRNVKDQAYLKEVVCDVYAKPFWIPAFGQIENQDFLEIWACRYKSDPGRAIMAACSLTSKAHALRAIQSGNAPIDIGCYKRSGLSAEDIEVKI